MIDTFKEYSIASLVPHLKVACKTRQNVLMLGEHGTGKTSVIKKLFDEHFGVGKWAYFSGASMDPFLDFIGCPKEKQINDVDFIKMVRPEKFANKEIKAIFIDELNRGDKHTRNAVMELIQTGSMNGDKIGNIELVWGAINPPSDEYDCEELDLSLMSRFHIRVKVRNQPDADYFIDKYGQRVARSAIEWWNSLNPDNQKLVCPRMLDFAIHGYINTQLPLDLFLPISSNPKQLEKAIGQNPIIDQLKAMTSTEELQNFFADDNNMMAIEDYVTDFSNIADYFHAFPDEYCMAWLAARQDNFENEVLGALVSANKDRPLSDFRNFLLKVHKCLSIQHKSSDATQIKTNYNSVQTFLNHIEKETL